MHAEDPRDASEAVRRRDGYEFNGSRMRVEIAKGGTGRAHENFRPPPSRGFRVTVKGLPRGASWQDLKVRGVTGQRVCAQVPLFWPAKLGS